MSRKHYQYSVLKALLKEKSSVVNPEKLSKVCNLPLPHTRRAILAARNAGRLELTYLRKSTNLVIKITNYGMSYIEQIEKLNSKDNPPVVIKIQPLIEGKDRKCLQCLEFFYSAHSGERICGDCKVRDSWRYPNWLVASETNPRVSKKGSSE